MQNLALILTLFVLVSCGKDSTSSSSPKSSNDDCNLNGMEVKCDSIQVADGQGIDLLDTIIDVQADISNSEITFQESQASRQEGRRITCESEVRSGEVYRYSINGNSLLLHTGSGSYTMKRLNDEGSDIEGAWSWRGYVGQGAHVIKTLTVIGKGRVILKTHCEM